MGKGKGGRPLKEINWEVVDNLLRIQCTGEEIAGALNIDYDTLAAACKREHKMSFSDRSEQKRAGGRASLRRRQWKTAEDGNATMLIWLGKQMLGQRDQPMPEQDDDAESLTVTINGAAPVTDVRVTRSDS